MNGGLKYLQLSNQPLTLDIAFKVAFFISCIQLTRTGNLHTVTVHFAPVGDPANGTCHCENDGEHGRRNTHRFQDDTRVEIDVRVQFFSIKYGSFSAMFSSSIATSSRSSLVPSSSELHGRFHALRWRAGRNFCTRGDRSPSGGKNHFIFRTTNKFRNVFNGADFFQHFQRRFVSTTVRRSPQ